MIKIKLKYLIKEFTYIKCELSFLIYWYVKEKEREKERECII